MTGQQRYFRPLEGAPQRRSFLAFDTEGVGGPGGFVCGAIVGELISEFYTEREAMWAALLDHGWRSQWLFAHNLEYDLPIVAGPNLYNGKLLFKRSGMLSADYYKGHRRARFLDSLNLFPRFSVASMGDMIGRPKDPAGAELVLKINAGARWNDFSAEDQAKLRGYCLRDAEIVYLAVSELQELLLDLGGELHSTIGAVSMDLFRRRHMGGAWAIAGEETNRLARPAFFGGRTENYAVGRVAGVNLYDTNSLYPHVMASTKFPHPSYLHFEGDNPAPRLIANWEGVAAASVRVPELWVPPLPQRLSERLFFPTGLLEGVWPICELREALRGGAELASLHWALGTGVLFSPFESFVRRLFQLRQGYLVNRDLRAQLVKLILVNLYGRFGLNYEPGLASLVPLHSVEDLRQLPGAVTHTIGRNVVAIGPLPGQGQPNYVNLLMATQITAAGRLHMLAAMAAQGEQLVYTDTDSIMTRGNLATGEGLGAWRPQMIGGEADLLGPKEYVLHNKVMGAKYVVKGIPERLNQAYITDGTVRFNRAIKVREAIAEKRNPSEWVETMRSRQPVVPKRRPASDPAVDPRGWSETLPWEVGALRAELGLLEGAAE